MKRRRQDKNKGRQGLLIQVDNGTQVKTIKSWTDNEAQVTKSNGDKIWDVKKKKERKIQRHKTIKFKLNKKAKYRPCKNSSILCSLFLLYK